MNKALLIIDMQLMPFLWKNYGGKEIYNEQKLLDNTQKLIEKARICEVPVYYILFTEQEGSMRAKNQPLWQVHPQIAPKEKDRIIVKYHADSFFETDLHALLQKDGITDIIVCGVQTEFCVDTTIRSAFSYGYHSTLAMDAHSTFDSELLKAEAIISHHNSILTQFTDIITTDDIDFHK